MSALASDVREHVAAIFNRAPFVRDLGMVLSDLGPGWCESALAVAPRHLQQDGYVHAGVQATVAESEVFAAKDGHEKLVAKATVTLAHVRAGSR